MKSLKRKFIISLIAIMFAIVALGTSTYAYWSSIKLTEVTNQQVIIGEGRVATVTASLIATLPEGKYLVPNGQAAHSRNPNNSVDSVTFKYEVKWEDDLVMVGTKAPLTVTITNLRLGESNAYNGLVNTVIRIESVQTENNASQDIERGANTEVTIVLTLTEPSNEWDYNAIINKNITFNVTFAVTPVATPAI